MTTLLLGERNAEYLREHLAAGQARTPGATVLVSVVMPVREADSVAFFARGADLAHDRFFWSSRHGDLTLAGVGAAWSVSAEGPDRFTVVAAAWRDLIASALFDRKRGTEGMRPLLLGGFAFDPLRPSTPAWQGYPDGAFFLPRFLLTTDIDGDWLTINTLVSPDADLDKETSDALDHCAYLLDPAPLQTQCNSIESVADVMSAENWQAIVASAVDDLAARRLDKVVLARSCRVQGRAAFDVAAVLRRLRAEYPSCYIFAAARGDSCFVGASPEQLAALRDGEIRTMSLAGSIARGATEDEDRRLAETLLASTKNRAEHAIVVRALREAVMDVGTNISPPGEPEMLKVRNVQHLMTRVTARLAPGKNILDLVARIHPTPAVGGYPVAPALQLIREREDLDRGWYAGPIGWLDGRGEGEFAVALRSALLQGDQALLFAGCGIVADSDPESEYAESCLKLRPMLSALEGAAR